MTDISSSRDKFPTDGISLGTPGNASDGRDMEIKIKDVLNRELKSRNQSIHSLAEATGIPSSTLHSWFNGQLPSGKNLHYLKVLADHFSIGLIELLYNVKDSDGGTAILFSSTFVDQDRRYRLIIERLPK